LQAISENSNTVSFKDVHDPNYDRQDAENALYHTVGPLTDNPRWTQSWTSRGSVPPPEFVPGGPAPRWTPEEVFMAMAGDPKLMFKSGAMDHPRSPSYGYQGNGRSNGGSPIYRMAMATARQYGRGSDKSFIEDLYGNGCIELSKLMHPGYDESRSPFISFAVRNIEGAIQNGIGGTNQGIQAMGGESKTGAVGIRGVLDAKTPDQVRKYANQVKGKYQTTRSNDKNPDNPFGRYSAAFYNNCMMLADAMESGDPDQVERAQARLTQLSGEIEDSQIFVPGASTGLGQAISTGDRLQNGGTDLKVSSMDVANDEGSTMAGNIADTNSSESWVSHESVNHILEIGLLHDVSAILGNIQRFKQELVKLDIDPTKLTKGPFTANEYRYAIRYIGRLASKYPGKGEMRHALDIPRDKPGWWMGGEDPEIEPIPAGGIWNSIWTRNGCNKVDGPTEVAEEMTQEVLEFEKLGIKTARTVKVKAKNSEAISKVSVNNAWQPALIKLALIARAEQGHLGMDESVIRAYGKLGIPITEGLDTFDRRIMLETCNYIIRKVRNTFITEGYALSPILQDW